MTPMTPIEALEALQDNPYNDKAEAVVRKALENAYHPDRLIIDRHELNRFKGMISREKFNKTVVAAQKLLKEHERLIVLCKKRFPYHFDSDDDYTDSDLCNAQRGIIELIKESEATDVTD